MLMPASLAQELNITTNSVAYKCSADHSVLTTRSLITAPADSGQSNLATA